jgi:hypothetical protein
MQKKLYFLNEEEKNRILNLHESRTKNQYLMNEQSYGAFAMSSEGIAEVVRSINGLCDGVTGGNVNSASLETLKKATKGRGFMSWQTYGEVKATLSNLNGPDYCAVAKKYNDEVGTSLIQKILDYIDALTYEQEIINIIKGKFSGKGGKPIYGSIASIAKTIQDWAQYPCVSKSNNVTPITLSDGSMAYEGGGFRWFGNRRNMNLTTKVMGDWHCDPADINRIKGGVDPKAQATTTKSTATTGGAPVTGMGSVLISPQQVTTLRTSAGLTGTGNSLSQQDINDLYNTINKLPNKQ